MSYQKKFVFGDNWKVTKSVLKSFFFKHKQRKKKVFRWNLFCNCLHSHVIVCIHLNFIFHTDVSWCPIQGDCIWTLVDRLDCGPGKIIHVYCIIPSRSAVGDDALVFIGSTFGPYLLTTLSSAAWHGEGVGLPSKHNNIVGLMPGCSGQLKSVWHGGGGYTKYHGASVLIYGYKVYGITHYWPH